MDTIKKLIAIQKDIKNCRACPQMCGTPVHGPAIQADVMLVGQAPGPHEAKFDKPFAYTSGKTLFKWFEGIISEEDFRSKIYIAATARCFPRKSGKGDRLPSKEEIENCSFHLRKEIEVLQPKLIIAVGRLAISEVLGPSIFPKHRKLNDVIGKKFSTNFYGHPTEVICLPHPSGVSRWPRTPEGALKISQAIALLNEHPVWDRTKFIS